MNLKFEGTSTRSTKCSLRKDPRNCPAKSKARRLPKNCSQSYAERASKEANPAYAYKQLQTEIKSIFRGPPSHDSTKPPQTGDMCQKKCFFFSFFRVTQFGGEPLGHEKSQSPNTCARLFFLWMTPKNEKWHFLYFVLGSWDPGILGPWDPGTHARTHARTHTLGGCQPEGV